MSRNAADQRKSDTPACPEARKRVAQVMDPNVGYSGQLSNLVPLLAKPIKSALSLLSREDPLVVSRRPSTLLFKDQESSASQGDDLRACLACFLAKHPEPEIHL